MYAYPMQGMPFDQQIYRPQVAQVAVPMQYVSNNPFEYTQGNPNTWFYKDPKGFSQGPFTAFQMQ
jgi:hypothetical protein